MRNKINLVAAKPKRISWHGWGDPKPGRAENFYFILPAQHTASWAVRKRTSSPLWLVFHLPVWSNCCKQMSCNPATYPRASFYWCFVLYPCYLPKNHFYWCSPLFFRRLFPGPGNFTWFWVYCIHKNLFIAVWIFNIRKVVWSKNSFVAFVI